MKFICIIAVLLFVSCSADPWSREEKTEFKNECLDSGADNSYCNCYQEKAMKEYPNYEAMDAISFEEAVELSINCK
ncbi:MAG: hypothetical protein ACI857_000848 [Arenicella sp.]|jgi:hypothetical protein